MAVPINTGSHPRLLLGDIGVIFGDHYAQLAPLMEKVYKKKMSDRNYEEAVQLYGMSAATIKGEGEAISLDGTGQGYIRRTNHTVWQKSAKITMEAVDDNRHLNMAQDLAKHLARSLFHAKEENGAALFNNATSTSAPYVGADGKAFIATDHPLAGGGTLSNRVASDISELALENAIIAMRGWTDNNSLLISAKPKSLLIPKDSMFDVHRILKSGLRKGTADNDANALKDMGMIPNILVWDFLTDTDSWFILTDQDGLCFYERAAAKASYEQEYNTKDHIYTMMERYSHDYYDPRCVYGSVGV